jgi:hypothetical protein
MYPRVSSAAALAAILLVLTPDASSAGDQDTPPRSVVRLAQADGPMVITPQPNPDYPHAADPNALPPSESDYDAGGPGRPYEPAPGQGGDGPPAVQSQDGFSAEEIKEAGHRFFGRVSMDLARVIEYAFQRSGRPNGYILGEEAGGAFVAGLRYGEGTLYTKDAGDHRVYWQGPSLGYDFGAEGSKTMVLVYDLRSPGEIFTTYAGVDGSAYFIGGVGITYLARGHMVLAPIRSGIGLRLGANVGYLKYTREPTWNPF